MQIIYGTQQNEKPIHILQQWTHDIILQVKYNMQQIESEASKLILISQGNNSYIHRASQGEVDSQQECQNFVIKSVYHKHCSSVDQHQEIPKCLHQVECRDLKNEWEILSTMDHPYIIQPHKLMESTIMRISSETIECCSLQMEGALCDYFNLLKNFQTSGYDSFSFKQRMHYIWQIGGAVGHLHSQQTCHNDIKLENILICTRDTAKLADFGFASRTTEKLIERWERRALNIYSAPEIVQFWNSLKESRELDIFLAGGGQQTEVWEDDTFSEASADMYALTTSLFITVYHRPPVFGVLPTLKDPLYSMLCTNPDDFWGLEQIQKVEQEMLAKGISVEQLESLKDLVESGLCDQDARITINEWQSHELWKDYDYTGK